MFANGMSGDIITTSGHPLRVRVDSGVPMNMLPAVAEEASFSERMGLVATSVATSTRRQKTERGDNTTTSCSGRESVLCCAIAVFVCLSTGIVIVVVFLWARVNDISDSLEEEGTPTLGELVRHVGAILNYTENAASRMEGMAHLTYALLGRTVGIADHALNVSDDIIHKVADFSEHPAMTLLGGVG